MYARRYAVLALCLAMPVFAIAGLGMALAVEFAVFLIATGAR